MQLYNETSPRFEEYIPVVQDMSEGMVMRLGCVEQDGGEKRNKICPGSMLRILEKEVIAMPPSIRLPVVMIEPMKG